MLSSMTAGCQLLDSEGSEDGQETTPDIDTPDEIHVGQTVSDLPSNPTAYSFGVTADGLFQFDAAADEWSPVQYGSTAHPVPTMNAQSATIGATPSGRPLISNGDRTVYVDPNDGDDAASGTEDDPLATIQEAVERAPIYLRDQYVVDLATVPDTPVTYDEDVLVPTIIGTGQAEHEDSAPEPGPFLNLIIQGEQDQPGAVEIGSVTFGNVVGTSAGNLFFATITRDSPYDDENFSLTAYGTGEVHVYDVRFTDGPSNGILAYGSKMKASLVDFGTGNLNIGIRGKRHASIIADQFQGEVNSQAYLARSNSKIGVKEGVTAFGDPTFATYVGGLIHDANTDTWYGVDGGQSEASGQQSASQSAVRTTSSHPDDARPGEVWYVDGSENVEEGFYGQTESGPVQFG